MGSWSLPPAFAGLVRMFAAEQPAASPPPVAAEPSRVAAAPAVSEVMGHDRWAPTARPTPKRLAPPPPPGAAAGRIKLDTVSSPFVKDPAFANEGAPIGGKRYMVFGDLTRFYLKGFDVAATAEGKPGLRFGAGEVPIDVKGLPAGVNGLWAPEVVVRGDRVLLLYAGGAQGFGGIDWPSFRLRLAEVPLRDFEAAVRAGKPVPFEDKGALFPDQATFGDDPSFAMIDPALHVAPDGTAHVTYTVVKHGIPGQRPHEEFVRSRRVDPENPLVALGPDTPMIDGLAGGRHDGVAEAQDVVTIDGKQVLFVSSRAGDKDQRVYAAPVDPGLGRVAEAALKPVLEPGGEDWSAKAVGSTGAAVIDGQLFVVHQGMGADGKFSLGFRTLAKPV